jgi:cytochrome P450
MWSSQGPALLARQSIEHGPVLRWCIPYGQGAEEEKALLVGPAANRFVLHTHRTAFSQERGWTPAVGHLIGKGLLNMDPPEHTWHRKLWNPAFTQAYMERYLPLMQRVIAEHLARWGEQGEIDLYHEARTITFHVAAAALAGIERGPEVERLQQLFYALIAEGASTLQSIDDRLPQALKVRDALNALLLDLIAERRRMPAKARPNDVLGLILEARDEGGHSLSDEQMVGHLTILLVAGHETTTVLTAYTLYRLATLPGWQRRVEAELDALLPDPDELLSVTATRELKTLDTFIKETGRLHSPVRSVPRQVLQEVEFAGYTLPAGTQVRLALAACHRLPSVFAEPETFDPDRFAPPREEDKCTPYGLVTFGGGPRLCIGIHFATIEVKAIVAQVLRAYRLEPLGDQPPKHYGLLATFLPNGMPMRVRAHNHATAVAGDGSSDRSKSSVSTEYTIATRRRNNGNDD